MPHKSGKGGYKSTKRHPKPGKKDGKKRSFDQVER